MNEKEIWKDVPGYEGLYEVSSKERVRSLDKISAITGDVIQGKILPQIETSSGKMMVRLSKKGIRKAFLIENLKNEVFPEPEEDYNPKEV